MITTTDLVELNITEPELYAIAIRNLTAYFAANELKVHRLEKTGTANVYVVSLDQTYEASLLLLDSYWDRPGFEVAGSPVAFVPARNIVLVTGTADTEGVRIATYLANQWFTELGYAISPKGYVYQSGTWVPYQP